MNERDAERFMAKVDRAANGCWLWTGAKTYASGYGLFWLDGKQISAHRAAVILFKQPIPSGKVVMHKCDDRSCVNPEHLQIGTLKDNSQDMVAKGRHVYGEHNKRAKVSGEIVKALRGEFIAGRDGEVSRLATKYQLSLSATSSILHGRTWRHMLGTALGSAPSGDPPRTRTARGTAHPNAKLDELKVLEIKARFAHGEKAKHIAVGMGLDYRTVWDVTSGKSWRHVKLEGTMM